MYSSVNIRNIELAICPNWAGDTDIYDNEVKSIELGVNIKNRSKEDLKIDGISLRIRKRNFFYYTYENLILDTNKQVISSNSTFTFIYDLKPILASQGNKKKMRIRITSGKFNIDSETLCIEEMHNYLVRIYARHF